MLLSKYMIGHDDETEEVHFKVADKRKFNSDGSVRDGVTLDAAPVAPKPPAPEPQSESATEEQQFEEGLADTQEMNVDTEEIPGANDPASFVNFLSMLATNAASALGAVPNPATGKRTLDLETGKYWLDVLAMIRDKTKSNLHPKEDRLIEGLLADLRLQYVQLVKATEEKLKAQAATQFSGDDIIGKK